MVFYINGMLSFIAVIGLTYVVMNPRIYEGVIIKLGLGIMILSLFATGVVSFDDTKSVAALTNSALLLKVGLIIVCFGYYWRYKKARRDSGPTDFGALLNHKGREV